MRAGRILAAGVLILAVPMGLCVAQAAAQSPSACAGEPGVGIDLRARLVSLNDTGATVRAVIDLGVRPDRSLARGQIQGQVRRAADGGKVLDLAARSLSIPTGNRVFLRYNLDIYPGKEYEIAFTLVDPESAGALSSTTLRINLDPSRQPQNLENRLQYRAQMQGR